MDVPATTCPLSRKAFRHLSKLEFNLDDNSSISRNSSNRLISIGSIRKHASVMTIIMRRFEILFESQVTGAFLQRGSFPIDTISI